MLIAGITIGSVTGYALMWMLSGIVFTLFDRWESRLHGKDYKPDNALANAGYALLWPALLPIWCVVALVIWYGQYLKKLAAKPSRAQRMELRRQKRDEKIAQMEIENGMRHES